MNYKLSPKITPFLLAFTMIFVHCEDNNDFIDVKAGVAAKEFALNENVQKEGRLGATAIVIQGGSTKLCIVSCDVIGIKKDHIDEVGRKIENELYIPFDNILVTSTHTHHGPSTDNPAFIEILKDAIFMAVSEADQKLNSAEASEIYFWLGQEATVGQNSRLLLSDSTIYWYGRKSDAIRPTGSFDPELPVIAFMNNEKKPEGVLFNHSTHTIGARKRGVLSPAFYGLAAQELEDEYGGKFIFLLGAHGSTHDFSLTTDEKIFRIREAVSEALGKSQKRDMKKLISVKEEFEYKVREFDDEKEEEAIAYYCRTRLGNLSEEERWADSDWDPDPVATLASFRKRREELEPHQGETRKTWLQVMVIGDIAFVGVPGELFNDLGLDIKRRSPYRYTYIIALANDAIGYIPDRKGFGLGGYQLWSNWVSHLPEGTGEIMADRAVQILYETYDGHPLHYR